jgi:hypothetical protein
VESRRRDRDWPRGRCEGNRNKAGRFAHFTNDDIDYFQSKVDDMWNKRLVPGVIPFSTDLEAQSAPD